VIPAAFDYQRATSVEDALARLAASEGAKLIAGGHSLVPMMKMRLAQPQVLVDIARIQGLSGIREAEGAIEIGACTVHREIAASALVRQQAPLLAETAADIGDPQVRNRGTLGGSLAHADPAADYPAAILALDATVNVQGPKGRRQIAASRYFKDLFTVDLAPDEIIVSVSFAPARASAYAKLHQRASHFAIVGVAAALGVAGGTIKAARVGLTGAASHALRLSNVERALTGRPATAESAAAAASLAGADLGPLNADLHASAEYRKAMIPVFTRRALEGALKRV
jgi:carbon-monoxide dehydrogenase medium subunit